MKLKRRSGTLFNLPQKVICLFYSPINFSKYLYIKIINFYKSFWQNITSNNRLLYSELDHAWYIHIIVILQYIFPLSFERWLKCLFSINFYCIFISMKIKLNKHTNFSTVVDTLKWRDKLIKIKIIKKTVYFIINIK